MDTIKKIIRLTDQHSIQLLYEPLFLRKDEVDLSRLLFIDYLHLAAEIATFGIVYASIGFEVADLKKVVALDELSLKVYKATTKKEIRQTADRKLTVDAIDDLCRTEPMYKVKNVKWIESLHRQNVLESLYWSMKSKDDKLAKLATTMSSQDFKNELLSTKIQEINYVKLLRFKNFS